MGSKEKVHRSARCSSSQKTAIVNHMHGNRDFAHGKFERERATLEWNSLARSLNEMQGCEKTSDQWQKAWMDIKQKTKSKYAALKDAKRRTGNPAIKKGMELDEEDMRVLAVMGPVTVHGIPGSWDSLPESEAAMMLLMNGDRSGARDEEGLGGCGASSPVNISSESDGEQVADTEDEENKDGNKTSTPIGKPSTSATGRRASVMKKKKNRGTAAMVNRLNYEEKTSHFAKMQERQMEAMAMMAKAQLMQAENEAKKLQMQQESTAELRQFRIEFARMTSYVGQIVECMTGEKAKK